MAAGYFTKTVKDGAGNSFNMRFYDSTNGDGTGLVFPAPVVQQSPGQLMDATHPLYDDLRYVGGTAFALGQATFAASLPVVQASVGYGGATLTITRPSDTTGYTAGDAVGDTNGSAILSFTTAGSSGGYVLINGVSFMLNLSAVPSGMTSFRLYLYDASPTAIADNVAWDLISGDRAAFLGYVDVGTPVDLGSTLFVQTDNINKKIKLASASTTLFGILVTNGAFTPTSAAVYSLKLHTTGL